MLKLKIYLRIFKKESKEAYVWISFYINREKVNFSTKVSVAVKNWSESKSMVLSTDSNASDKNRIIENFRARINNVFVLQTINDASRK